MLHAGREGSGPVGAAEEGSASNEERGLFSPARSVGEITGRLREELGAGSVPRRAREAAGSGAGGSRSRRDTPRPGENFSLIFGARHRCEPYRH